MTPISINPATKRDSSLEQPSKKINSKEGYERILPSDRCFPSFFLLSLSLSLSPHSILFLTSVESSLLAIIKKFADKRGIDSSEKISASIYRRIETTQPALFSSPPAFSGRFNPWGFVNRGKNNEKNLFLPRLTFASS